MLVVSVTKDFLDNVIETMKLCDYDALVIVLANTADAGTLHDHMTQNWPSLHSVSHSLVALLCPDPATLGHRRGWLNEEVSIEGGPDNGPAAIDGFALRHPTRLEAARFAEHFWRQHRPTASAADHHAAWTESTRRCADYFGIINDDLPAILTLFLWQKTAVVVRRAGELQPYFILRDAMRRLGQEPQRLRQAIEIRNERQRSLERSQERVDKAATEELSSKLDLHVATHRLKRALEGAANSVQLEESQSGIDSALIKSCQSELNDWIATHQNAGSFVDLEKLHHNLAAVPDISRPLPRTPINRFFRRRHDHEIMLAEYTKCQEGIERLETELTEAEDAVGNQREKIRLETALIAEFKAAIGDTTWTESIGVAGLDGWTLRTIGAAPRQPTHAERRA